MKLLAVLAMLSSSVVLACCIDLGRYQLSGRQAQSEIEAFNSEKLRLYREFVTSENQINSSYSSEVQRLYQRGYSDDYLRSELRGLERRKDDRLAQNCRTYKNRFQSLVRSF